jgi:outer membrane protein
MKKNNTHTKFLVFIAILCLPLLFPLSSTAQRVLDLEESVNIAVQNNLDVKIAMNNAIFAKTAERQGKLNYLPSVSANNNYNAIFGTTFDQASGRLVNTATFNSSPQLVADFILFNGFRNHMEMSRTKMELESAVNNMEQSKLSIKILVTGLFLQVISNQENLKVSKERIKVLEDQLSRAEKQANAGAINVEQVYNLRSQVATEKLNYVNLENQMKANRLSLLLELQLDPNGDYVIKDERVDLDLLTMEVPDFNQLHESAEKYSPAIKSASLRYRSESFRVKSVQANRLPVIAMSGAIGSNYSSNFRTLNDETQIATPIPYLEQVQMNNYQFLAVRINIPIFNRFQTSMNIQSAKMSMKNAELEEKRAKNNLNNDLQRAYQDLLAAKSTYMAASESLNALQQTFKFAEARYNAGAIDFYSFMESLNNKNRAEVEMAVAKYSFAFRKRILDLYKGE